MVQAERLICRALLKLMLLARIFLKIQPVVSSKSNNTTGVRKYIRPEADWLFLSTQTQKTGHYLLSRCKKISLGAMRIAARSI